MKNRELYEVDAAFIVLGYWDANEQCFIGLAHQMNPPLLVKEYSATQETGTARATRAVKPGKQVNPFAEMSTVLENRCSDCHEQLFLADANWLHEDGTPVCSSVTSLQNIRMIERLRHDLYDWDDRQ